MKFKGRGAQQNVANRFSELTHEERDDFKEYLKQEEGEISQPKTTFIKTYPKSIVNEVPSPDISMQYSLNPYQGCEHGCIYCYARNTHEFWGYGAGLDFEQKIIVKENAKTLLEKHFQKKSWKVTPIILSGNTDCYQPIEKKLEITRSLLKKFLDYKHPVGIITKNALVQRDIDILQELAKDQLVRVMISVTSLSDKTRRIVEPRTTSINKRLQTIEKLTAAGIPVGVMVAPIIPGINSHEILPIVKAVADCGALAINHNIVRLNGPIAGIFEDWIRKTLPDRADKVLHQIADCHGGNLNDSQYGRRIKGSGNIASQINRQFEIANHLYMKDRSLPDLNCNAFVKTDKGQLGLW